MLLFQDHYKFDQRNPKACEVRRYILVKVGNFLKSEQFREKVERVKRNILSGSKKQVMKVKMMMMTMMMKMMMMVVNLMITMTTSIQIARLKSSQALKHLQTVQSITY